MLIGLANDPCGLYLFNGKYLEYYGSGYSTVKKIGDEIFAYKEFDINGTIFELIDRFTPHKIGVLFERKINILKGSSYYQGFFSALEIKLAWEYSCSEHFAPGVWYHKNEYTCEDFIGHFREDISKIRGNLLKDVKCISNIIREDRLALPLFLCYDSLNRYTFSFLRLDVEENTVEKDDVEDILIDERISFGSLGEKHLGDIESICFWFPGSEGDMSYPPLWVLPVICNRQEDSPINPFKGKLNIDSSKNKWCYRFHPIKEGLEDKYKLLLIGWKDLDYIESLKRIWRMGTEIYNPKIYEIDLEKVKDVSITLLSKMVRRYPALSGHEVPIVGIPTWIDCYTGETGKYQNTFSLGFVGRNIEAGYLLLKMGYEQSLDEYIEKGREMINFWVEYSGFGLSHTDFDFKLMEWTDAGKTEDGKLKIFLRQESEDHYACLKALELEKEKGFEHLNWLKWNSSFAKWLLENQNSDGSFYKAYTIEGKPASKVTAECAHVIPFLNYFAKITDSNEYEQVAIKVAKYLYENLHKNGYFYGGTLDNPDCYDKEACIIAFEAYLNLYETTKDNKWLEAAELSATFAETWIYLWDIPMPVDDPNRFYSPKSTTVGLQLITTGCSAVDMYLSRYGYLFRKLAMLTGDEHYNLIANILHYNTKVMVQLSNFLGEEMYYGYVYPGFQIEHWSMGRGRGYGLNSGWLPWVSVNHMVDIIEFDPINR